MSKGKKGKKLKQKAKPKFRGIKYWGPPVFALLMGMGIELLDTSSDIRIATAKDLEGDAYEGQAPVYNNGKIERLIDEGTMILVDESVKNDDKKMYDVTCYSKEGESIHGIMHEDYLNIGQRISRSELEKYNHIYEVTSTDKVNVRSSTEFDDENIITTIPEGIRVLGGNRIISKENEFIWVQVMFIDENGKTDTGYIYNDYLNVLDEMSIPYQEAREREMMVNTTSKTLNLRSSTSSKDNNNIILKIPNGKIVKTTGREDEISEATKWTEITFTDEEGKEHTGWVMSSYLEEYGLILKQVVTGKKGLNLNVRNAPGLASDIIADIENGAKIEVSNFDIANMKKADGAEWVRINLNDGSYGYVAYHYLVDASREVKNEELLSDEEIQKILDKTRVNKDGNVVGIDISWMSAKDLERMLKNPNIIPDNVYKTFEKDDGTKKEVEYKTSDLAGNINFVIIKIGASDYKSGTLYDNGTRYIDQALVCEKLGVPYGFYYYSTAITKEEAEREIQDCKKLYDAFCEKCPNKSPKYDILPFFEDLESHPNSRVLGKDLSEVTAYWINRGHEILETNVGLYSGGKNVSYVNGDDDVRLLKLDKIEAILGYKPPFWGAYSRNTKNPYNSDGQNHLDSIIERGYNPDIVQTVLGAHTSGKDGVSECDIDIIDKRIYDKMIWSVINKKRENYKRKNGVQFEVDVEEIINQTETNLMIDRAIEWFQNNFGEEKEERDK